MEAKWEGDMKFSSFLNGGTEILVTFVRENSNSWFLWISIQFQDPLPSGKNDTSLTKSDREISIPIGNPVSTQ